MKNLLYLSLFLCILSIAACKKDSKDDLQPDPEPEEEICDTAVVTFNNSVLPILENHCFGCHGTQSNPFLGDDINLEGYDNFMVKVNEGKVLPGIKHEPGFKAMPKDREKLSDCEIGTIEKWINEGAQNN